MRSSAGFSDDALCARAAEIARGLTSKMGLEAETAGRWRAVGWRVDGNKDARQMRGSTMSCYLFFRGVAATTILIRTTTTAFACT